MLRLFKMSFIRTFMDVAVDVILGADPLLNCCEEFDTPGPDAGATKVAEANWRGMGHQDVSVRWDKVPLVQHAATPGQVEGPATELGLPRTAVNLH